MMKGFDRMLDSTDLLILELLLADSRLQWKEVGEKVHLSGQAVASRIRKMENLGIIEGYTVKINLEKLGKTITALVNVSMKTVDHQAFQHFIRGRKDIIEAHRISGGGCYFLKAVVDNQQELNLLLDEILKYGNYSVSISIANIK